jgi:hypothetical protein
VLDGLGHDQHHHHDHHSAHTHRLGFFLFFIVCAKCRRPITAENFGDLAGVWLKRWDARCLVLLPVIREFPLDPLQPFF